MFSLLIKVFKISSLEAFRAVWQSGGEAFARKPEDGANI
jgi:hypothetical protein